MTRNPKAALRSLERFFETYGKPQTTTELAVENEVFGAQEGIRGYTTPAQADMLAERLALRPDTRLLDVGAGRGWPSLYLARTTGCQVVISDVPLPALLEGMTRAHRHSLQDQSSFLAASGTHLPFRPKSFDAVVHTDVL
jgi:2-polyprenyl-3-methyl-5-hydroxy-6-metoxy-1,4-benzoquinol methylase